MRNTQQKIKGFEQFSKKITALIMVVSLTPLMIVTGMVVERYKTSYQAKTRAHLEELVKKNAGMVDTFLEERLRNISFLARAFTCGELSDTDFLNTRLRDLQNEYGTVFEDMGFVNQHGRQIAYAGRYHLQNAHYADADWFKQAIAGERTISDTFLGLRGFPHCIVTARKICGKSTWVLRATIDFSAFSAMVEKLRVGRSGHAFIVNKGGEFQTRRPEAFTGVPVHRPEADPERDVYLKLTAPIKGGDWLLVVMQKRTDAFEEVNKAHKIAFAALFFGLVSSVVTAFYVPALIYYKMTKKKVNNA